MPRGRNPAVFGGSLRFALACGAPPAGGDGLHSGPRRKPSPGTIHERKKARNP